MMADEVASSSFLVAPRSTNLITSPNHNDVLMGRGTGSNDFIGNQRFRSQVEQRKEEYKYAPENKTKMKIVKELLDHIHVLGGRFLKQMHVEGRAPVNDIFEEVIWCEEQEKVALAKCKQALRKKENQGALVGMNKGFNAAEAAFWGRNTAASSSGMGVANPEPLGEGFVHEHPPSLPPNLTTVLPSMLAESTGPCVVETRPFPFQSALFALQQQATAANPFVPPHFSGSTQSQKHVNVLPDVHASAGSMSQMMLQDLYRTVNTSAAAAYGSYLGNGVLSSGLGHLLMRQKRGSVSAEPREKRHLSAGGAVVATDRGGTVATARPSTSEDPVTAAASEDDMSEFVLSLLTLGRPIFTEEQLEMERAATTDEERLAALSDMFGKSCPVETSQRKRAKRDLDQESIDFFVQQMRLELERIPEDRKRALVEAQTKCHADEFSDARLERFLRCEGMNAKLGAQRFVNYWESRRELFGPEKFVMRLTLSEALCDDLVAVEVGLCQLLPHLDTSGRQLLLWDPCRHKREGYTGTVESMLRALWYVIDVTAQENADIQSGVVMIIWNKESTMWDFDYKFYERMTYFERACWPVKRLACHVCFAPWIVINIGKPMIYALMDKDTRSRTLFHTVPESQILDVLSGYGILKDMLPTKMGGTLQFDQAEWIANRSAAELEEFDCFASSPDGSVLSVEY